MRYRPLAVADLPEVAKLYRAMLAEGRVTTRVRYPQWDATKTVTEMQRYLYEQLTRPARSMCPHCMGDLGPNRGQFIGVVAVLGNSQAEHAFRVKGMAWGSIYERQVGEPKTVAYCELIYVDPAFRAGRGQKRDGRGRAFVGVELIRAVVAEVQRRAPDAVLEGAYVPGSHGSRLWPRLGLRPYVTYCAFADAEGNALPPDVLLHHRPLRSVPRREGTHG